LILWALVPVVFYTMSVGQQPRYILPVLPPLAILVARSLLTRLAAADAERRRAIGVAIAISVSAIALLILAYLMHRARPLVFAQAPQTGHIGIAVIGLAGLGLLLWTWLGRQRWLPAAIAISGALTLVSLQFTVYSAGGLEPVQQIARELMAVRKGEPSGTYRAFVRNLVFYTGVNQDDLVDENEAVEYLQQPRRVLCVMPLGLRERLEQDRGLRLQELARVVYFNPSSLRLRTLFSPNPERALETVVLVTNRP
jgi:4-amino-4-deoxy-L-arabinose transferase-like glycosyltransferase